MAEDEMSQAEDAGQGGQGAPNYRKSWTEADDWKLCENFSDRSDIQKLMVLRGRNDGGIESRWKLHGLLDDQGQPVIPKPPFSRRAKYGPGNADQPSGVGLANASRPSSQHQLDRNQLNESERYFLRLFRQIPRGKKKGIYMVMRALAVPVDGDLPPELPPDIVDANASG
jgi:hypothetical protein